MLLKGLKNLKISGDAEIANYLIYQRKKTPTKKDLSQK